MTTSDDFTAPLTEEILADVAGRFFGSRRELDAWLETFESVVAAVREKANRVAQRAGVLNRLLLQGKAVRAFYHELAIDAVAPLLAHDSPLVGQLPPAKWYLRGGMRYAQWVMAAYGQLRDTVVDYREGGWNSVTDADTDVELASTASLRLVRVLADEINKRIDTVNQDMNPADTLQFARGLACQWPAPADGASDVCVPFCDYSNSYNRKLAFTPIALEALQLPDYPALPPLDHHRRRMIAAFCRALFHRERHRIVPLWEHV
jgi:hypothetical protein